MKEFQNIQNTVDTIDVGYKGSKKALPQVIKNIVKSSFLAGLLFGIAFPVLQLAVLVGLEGYLALQIVAELALLGTTTLGVVWYKYAFFQNELGLITDLIALHEKQLEARVTVHNMHTYLTSAMIRGTPGFTPGVEN